LDRERSLSAALLLPPLAEAATASETSLATAKESKSGGVALMLSS